MIACENSDIDIIDHFTGVNKMVQIGSGAYRERKQKSFEEKYIITIDSKNKMV